MLPRRILFAALAATFLLGLLLLFPARLAAWWFLPADIRLAGVEGTVWRGTAAQVSVQGLYAAPLRWRFRPAALLTGRLGYNLEAALPDGSLNGNVGVSLTGSITVSDVDASLPLASISRLLPVAQAEGRLRAAIDYAVLSNGWPRELVGVISIEDLVYRPAGNASIGNYRVEFVETEDDGLLGMLGDGGGPLEVSGQLSVTAEGDYELRGRVLARPGAPRALANSLRYLGSEDPAGRREFSLAGRL